MIRLSSDFASAWPLDPLDPLGPDLNVVFICLYHLYLSVSQCQIQSFKCWWLQVLHLFALLSVGRSWLLRLPDVSTAMPSWEADVFLLLGVSLSGTAVRRFNNLAGEESTMSLTQTADLRCLALKIASSLHRFHAWCVRTGAAQQTWHTMSRYPKDPKGLSWSRNIHARFSQKHVETRWWHWWNVTECLLFSLVPLSNNDGLMLLGRFRAFREKSHSQTSQRVMQKITQRSRQLSKL